MPANYKAYSNKDMQNNKILNVPTPVNPGDAVPLSYIDELCQTNYFQDSTKSIQRDATTVPVLVTGNRYIIIDKDNLNAAFGGPIAGLGNNDIVVYNGTGFELAVDVSITTSEFFLAYVEDIDTFYQYEKATDEWMPATGLNEVPYGEGLVYNAQDVLVIDKTLVATKKTFTIGDGVTTSFLLTHNMDNTSPNITIKETATNSMVNTEVLYTSNNTITVNFNTVPSLNGIRVEVIG